MGYHFDLTGQTAELSADIADQLIADLPDNFEVVKQFYMVVYD